MYPHAALATIDQRAVTIMLCLLVTGVFAFGYFGVGIRLAIRQQVYAVPLTPAALFFWHDLTFVLFYDKWFHQYNHWWVKLWWYALIGTVALEAFVIFQVIKYGKRELWPNLARPVFVALIAGATIGVGAIWALVKASIEDELFFITFAITATIAIPFHTAILSRRGTRAGQSIFMQLSQIIMIMTMSAAFMQVSNFFWKPAYLAYVAATICWALVNIWLIRRAPEALVQPINRQVTHVASSKRQREPATYAD